MFGANASQKATDSLYVEDVFSTYLYTGNGSTQTINNGIDLAGKGGLWWGKGRSNPGSLGGHGLVDTARGRGKLLMSQTSGAEFSTAGGEFVTSFNSDGVTIGSDNTFNRNGESTAGWTFRKAPKFFDVVTWTGNGVTGRQIPHSLGSAPGCIIAKQTNGTNNWVVYHQNVGTSSANSAGYNLFLDATNDRGTLNNIVWNGTAPTANDFTVGSNSLINGNGNTYVAYLFAHNAGGFGPTGTDNVISCGGGTFDSSGYAVVNLGYEPQWVLIKPTSYADNWYLADNMRGTTALLTSGTNSTQLLYPNLSNAETATSYGVVPNATGFTYLNGSSGQSYIYIAIRRPHKPPTSGTEVFAPVYATSAASPYTVTTNFPVDLSISSSISTGGKDANDRLRGGTTTSFRALFTFNTDAESVSSGSNGLGFQSNTSIIDNNYWSGYGINVIYWNFRRAPGFFDVVCWSGTGASGTTAHNLGVVPELIITKTRNFADNWSVAFGFTPATQNNFYLNMPDGNAQAGIVGGFNVPYTANWNEWSGAPTSATLSFRTINSVRNHVSYLFASCPGVSKVGTFTGNGSSQTINCGFTAGARFVLVKRTDSTGDWYLWDVARGIVAANDPHLSLNTTAAEVTTDDSIDPDATGFIVNQNTATNINVNGGTYIFLAIA